MKSLIGFTAGLLLVFMISACSSVVPRGFDSSVLAWDELEEVGDTLSAAAATTYYVSGTGNDNNDGKSTTTAFRTLQTAHNLTNPGDTVLIMNGTYTSTNRDGFPGDILSIYRSGAPGQYIRYKAYPGHTPKLKSGDNDWQAIYFNGVSHILIEGLTLEGNNDNVTEAQARTQLKDTNGDGKIDAMEPNPKYSGNGIGINPDFNNPIKPSHHIIIRKNTVYKFGGGGIYTTGADFVVLEDNVVYNNAWYAPWGSSGISFYQNRDTQTGYTGYRMIARRNISYGNRNFFPCSCFDFDTITDGNGIIVDDLRNTQNGSPYKAYTGKTLLANNIVYENWGRGLHVFLSDNVDIINNTAFSNSYGPTILQGQISVVNASNVRVYNNIAAPYQYRSGFTNKSYTPGKPNNSNVTFDYNLSFGGTGFFDPNPDVSDPITTKNNLVGVNPQFVNAGARNFKLQASSPAIDKGYNFGLKDDFEKSLRPKGTGVDIGAYEIR
jgi:parallel beta-helix repeat protein